MLVELSVDRRRGLQRLEERLGGHQTHYLIPALLPTSRHSCIASQRQMLSPNCNFEFHPSLPNESTNLSPSTATDRYDASETCYSSPRD